MPTRKAGVEELRKNRKRRLHNLDIKSDLRKTIKKYLTSIQKKNKDEAKTNLNIVFKKIDKAAKRNILTKNTAARRKSRFSRLLLTVA